MQGVSIFLHAVMMVLNNIGTALRISGVLMLAQFALTIALGAQANYVVADMGADPGATLPSVEGFAGFVVVFITQMLIALWIVVAWHRFILREEAPSGYFPALNTGAMVSYAIASIIAFLVVLPVIIVMSILGALVASPFLIPGGAVFVGVFLLFIIVALPAIYVFYRISPILPSAALQERLPLREAWYATGTSGASFIVMAVVSGLAWWIAGLPGQMLGNSFAGFVWSFALQWLVMLIGASIVTTIYGHYVEKRPLAG